MPDHMPGTAQIETSSMSSSETIPVRCPLPPSTPTKSAVSRVPKLSSPSPRESQPPCASTGNSAGFALRPSPRMARTSCDELASVLSMLCGWSAVVAAVNRTGPSVSCTRLPASSVNCAATMASTRDSRSVSNSEWSNGWSSVTTSPAMPVTVRGIRCVPSSAWTWAPTYSREAPPTRNVLTVLSGLVRRTLRIVKPLAQRACVVFAARVSVNCVTGSPAWAGGTSVTVSTRSREWPASTHSGVAIPALRPLVASTTSVGLSSAASAASRVMNRAPSAGSARNGSVAEATGVTRTCTPSPQPPGLAALNESARLAAVAGSFGAAPTRIMSLRPARTSWVSGAARTIDGLVPDW